MIRPADIRPADLLPAIERLWQISGLKIHALESAWNPADGAPVYTVAGRYTTRGWTDWTEGFRHGSALLQFDATGDEAFLDLGRRGTIEHMSGHVTHFGVHDHGFNCVSTYGALLRLMNEGRIPKDRFERALYSLALRASGAVQAHRWTRMADGGGVIYSFNGPHSLFADTIRSLRSLALAHRLGAELLEEQDSRQSLLQRLAQHGLATARYSVYYGEGRDSYDVPGRVAHESLFNPMNGTYRCPSTQQGYSPFTTWTRGLAWIMLGFAEQLEFLESEGSALDHEGKGVQATFRRAGQAACEFYVQNTPADGIPYWDTGAPGLREMGDYLARPADPFNDHEPVDSSAAAIAAQGLIRMGRYLQRRGDGAGDRLVAAGLTVAQTLLGEPYLCEQDCHQGLILHSVYHRPNGWDYVPSGRRIPCGESSMWGDYHARELALYIQRLATGAPYYTFFGPWEPAVEVGDA